MLRILVAFIILPLVLAIGEELTLDITNEAPTEDFNCYTQVRDVITYTSFSVSPFVRVTCVLDGEKEVWKAEEPGEKCSSLTFHRHYDTKVLAYIYVANGRKIRYLHFQCKDNVWSRITVGLYRQILHRLLGERKFDISNPDTLRYFTIQRYTEETTPAKMYIPQPMYSITAILDSGKIVWEGAEGEKATFIVIHGYDGMPKFLHMYVKRDGYFDTIYFERDEKEWVPLYKDVFFKKLGMYRVYDTRL